MENALREDLSVIFKLIFKELAVMLVSLSVDLLHQIDGVQGLCLKPFTLSDRLRFVTLDLSSSFKRCSSLVFIDKLK